MKLLYLSLMRFPNEKAHSLQIVQNCEALAQVGYTVELWVTGRKNTDEMAHIGDVFAYYGVEANFVIRRVPVLDLMPYTRGIAERVAFYIMQITFLWSLFFMLWRENATVYYTRDENVALLLTWLKPRSRVAYEAHLFSPSQRGAHIQRWVCQRVGKIIAITPRLADDLIAQRGATSAKVLIAHDGFRAKRFHNLPTQAQARQALAWSDEWFIVGFVGRLQMLNMDKGVGTLIQAIVQCPHAVCLAIVGGPDDIAESYRREWLALGLPNERFLYVGHVAPEKVPSYISAFDVCAMPHPNTAQYANYTSPLKLFEYMACGKAIVASDLAGWRDVLREGDNALLVPPDNAQTLSQAIHRLQTDTELRGRLGITAQRDAQHYTWQARAERIRAHLMRRL
jgi:glycosyltransferase involved in cell wall biosynthesis